MVTVCLSGQASSPCDYRKAWAVGLKAGYQLCVPQQCCDWVFGGWVCRVQCVTAAVQLGVSRLPQLRVQVLVYGDCAVNVEPNSQDLATIAVTSAETAAAFGIEPRVALLSYSTGASGSGPQVGSGLACDNSLCGFPICVTLPPMSPFPNFI